MAVDEPRRSGRATKGQHKNLEAEPTQKRKGSAKSKTSKKADEPEQEVEDDDDEEEDVIRCVCGHNVDDVVGTKFVACDSCSVWQHSVCMGLGIDDDAEPEHYFCEQCRPEEHQELLAAMEKGEQLWIERQKAAKLRKKGGKKGQKGGRQSRVSDIKPESTTAASSSPAPASQELGSKRKFEEDTSQASSEPVAQPSPAEPKRGSTSSRGEKRRKSSTKAVDVQTAVVELEQLPPDRRNVAQALQKAIAQGVRDRTKAGSYRVPDGDTPESLGRHHSTLIEYELFMNYNDSDGPLSAAYGNQFRQILPNMKKNAALLDRLLKGSLTASELAIMPSQDMASEELQKERAQLKEEADKQAVMIREDDGPRVRRTHKGEEYVDDGAQQGNVDSVFTSQPVRHRESIAEIDMGEPGSPSAPAAAASPDKTTDGAPDLDRRQSAQQFDINSVWAKTQQSPDSNPVASRQSVKRQDSAPKQEQRRTEDADVDRLLADDDDDYTPNDLNASDATVVWRGRVVQSGVADFTATGRYVAGNDFSRFVPWKEFLPSMLEIEGRLDKAKADDYLCGLQWSKKSDVSVLALTPYDNREAFDALFDYFATRNRYAVAKKGHGMSELVKDLYISPIAPGNTAPPHIDLLDYVGVTLPLTERMLFVTYVVNKPTSWEAAAPDAMHTPVEGNNLPPHLRQSLSGPAGSPIATQNPAFSPRGAFTPDQSQGAGLNQQGGGQAFGQGALPPNPYSAQQQPFQNGVFQPSAKVQHFLGPYANAPVVAQIVAAAQGNMEDIMLKNMRDILEREPRARDDMAVFASLLQQ